jgi:peptidoglycan/xylan/chitin deacetylase (PgdA/CDA1 family)
MERAMRWRTAVKLGLAGALVEVYRLARAAAAPRIHVFDYHRVVDRLPSLNGGGPVNPALCVTTDTFRRQMQQVRERFRVLTLEQALFAIDGSLPLERDACAITFDDGYADVYLRARPILAELGLPAAVFVPSGFVGTGRHLTHDRLYAALQRRGETDPAAVLDELIGRLPAGALDVVAEALERELGGAVELDEGARVLDERELRALADGGWEIGAHTVDHVVLTHERPARVDEELRASKATLERIGGRPVRYFAYCNGFHSPALVDALRRAGYEGAVTTFDRPNRRGGDRFRVARKVLWEAHARGLDGRFAPSLSAANLHDLFGALHLTRPVDGEVRAREDPCSQAA